MGKTGGLLDRQGIHISAKADGLSPASGTKHANHPRFGDAGMHLVHTKFAQLLGNDARCSCFLEAKLGMSMKIPAPSGHFRLKFSDTIDDCHLSSLSLLLVS